MSIRDDFFASKAIGALWDVAVSIKRGNPLPLDSNSVFESYEALQTYASGVLAYPGQVVAVVNADSTGIYYLDQELAIQEVGSVPTADNASIQVTDGILAIYGFGNAFYKYVEAVTDETTGEVTEAAHYEKVEVSDENPWVAGLEPRVVSEDGELVIGWFEPNPTTIDGIQDQVTAVQGTVEDLENTLNAEGGLVDQVEDLQEEIGHAASETGDAATGLYAELDKKADKESVYTKEETAQLIAEANHLKRKIFDTIELAQEFVDANSETADQYIYMIPSGLQLDSNRYYEYMVVEGTLEQVGNWEVDLADYFTEEELKTYLESYYTSEQVDTILTAYAKTTDLEGYYTSTQVDTLLEKYYTQEELDALLEKYVLAEEGKSLVSDTEIAKLATVSENAEENFIKSVNSDQFTVTEAGELNLNQIEIADVANLQATLDSKANIVYYSVTDPETGEITQVAGQFLTPEDREKLNALVIGEEGVEISGTVNASNVEGLATWITNNRDNVAGLFSTSQAVKLDGIEEGAEKNFISSVDTAELAVDENGNLTLVNPPLFTSVSSDFIITESKTLELANEYVTTGVYAAEVGDLSQLLRVTGNESSTLVEEVNYINERLKWGELTE